MKKTLVALAVLAAAGSVNAAEVYNADGIVTTVSGVAEIQVTNNYKFADADTALRVDDFDLTANTVVAVSDTMSALGQVSLGSADNDDKAASAQIDRTFVGLTFVDAGTLTFGKQLLVADDAGNSADFELGGDQYGEDVASGNDVVKYVYDNGQLFAAISHDLKETNTDETVTDGRLGFRTGDFEGVVYAYEYEDKSKTLATDTGEVSSYDIELNYAMDNISLAGSYGYQKKTSGTDVETKTRFIQANVGYAVDTVTYNLGYSQAKVKDADAVNTVYANVIKQLATNVRVYVEAGSTSADDSEFSTLAGMEVKF